MEEEEEEETDGKELNSLFSEVLAKKDLSRAGELFSLSDDVIERDLEEVIEKIIDIADSDSYEESDNDQSVVEICITRITTAIRETDNINKHAEPLVRLLSICHKHNLSQTGKDEDPPHAKIASDIMSRLFTYYSNSEVMALTIPAVVQFLDCDNKDLVRSVASYLSLATLHNTELLACHMALVLTTVLRGNYLLGQVLPQIYQWNPAPVLQRVEELMELMAQCEAQDKVCLVMLFSKIAKSHPSLLEPYVGQLVSLLPSPPLSSIVLATLLDLAAARPSSVAPNLAQVQAIVATQPTLMAQVAQITGSVGATNQEEGQKSLDYLVSKLQSVDQAVLSTLLQEVRGLGRVFPSFLSTILEELQGLPQGSSAVRMAVAQIRDDMRQSPTASSQDMGSEHKPSPPPTPPPTQSDASSDRQGKQTRSVSSQTEGQVTIITVGNPPNAAHPSGHVSVRPCPPSSSTLSLARISRASSPGIHVTSENIVTMATGTDNNSMQNIPVRDGVQLFCEKHFAKIKTFIDKFNSHIPLPAKCSVVNGKHKRYLKLHFECGQRGGQCLYPSSHFTLNTRLPKVWLHLMFLSVQAQSRFALSQKDLDVSSLKTCWDALKGEASSSFLTLVTSSFPTQKDQQGLLQELYQMRYFDVFEINRSAKTIYWACFMCNHPERLSELLNDGYPEIAGQLKEKKGKWKFFKRWKTRYFTLSGGSITYDKSNSTKASLPVTKIQSVKAVRKDMREIPRAFQIFTEDNTYMFKAKGQHDVQQWVQCLHLAVARSNGTSTSSLHPLERGATSATDMDPGRPPGAGDFLRSKPIRIEGGRAGVWGAKVKYGKGNSLPTGAGSRMAAHPGLFDPQPSDLRPVNPKPLKGSTSRQRSVEAMEVVTNTKL